MSTISLEMGEARKPCVCECCGIPIETTHGFIYRNDDAFAVYQAAWCEGHPENQVNSRIEVGGDWGNAADRPKHAFFGVLIFQKLEETAFSFLEPEESQWFSPETANAFLSRAAALAHPLKDEIFHIAEHMARDDARIRAFLDGNPIDA